jgi:CheY-like chemotaxis protein
MDDPKSEIERARPLQGSLRKRRVLVVDDDCAVRFSICRLLSGDFDIDTAASAEQALALAEAKEYDVVICDYEMPGRDGLWLLRELRQRSPGAIRVLHSGSDPEGVADHVREGLVDRFIPKPISAESISWLN